MTAGVPRRIADILNDIRYRDWRIVARELEPRGFVQLGLEICAPCAVTGMPSLFTCQDRLIGFGELEEAIVRQVMAMVLSAEEHEARERFTYKGVRVFNPHQKLITQTLPGQPSYVTASEGVIAA